MPWVMDIRAMPYSVDFTWDGRGYDSPLRSFGFVMSFANMVLTRAVGAFRCNGCRGGRGLVGMLSMLCFPSDGRSQGAHRVTFDACENVACASDRFAASSVTC